MTRRLFRRPFRAAGTRRNARRQRGAVLVEFAIISTLLGSLAFGIVEFGMAWQDKMTVETAARAGARTGSSVGKERLADYAIIEGVRSALDGVGLGNVDYVVVYKAATADGEVPAGCKAGTSQPGVCNVYTGAQLATISQSSFTGTTGCGGGSPDRFWCPTSRQTVQALGTDYLGVWVKAQHPTITKFFGSSITVTSKAVMRLEPAESSS